MTRNWFVAGLLNLVALTACLAAAIGVVMVVNSVLHFAWPSPSMAARLAYSLTAPFAVVLFALLVEQTGRIAVRTKLSTTPTDSVTSAEASIRPLSTT